MSHGHPFRIEPFEGGYGKLAGEAKALFEVPGREVFDLPLADLSRHLVHHRAMNQELALQTDQPMALEQISADSLDRCRSRSQELGRFGWRGRFETRLSVKGLHLPGQRLTSGGHMALSPGRHNPSFGELEGASTSQLFEITIRQRKGAAR